MWEFCAPLALSYVFETSILPAALFAFSAQLVCILGGSFIGNWVDKAQRLVGNPLYLFCSNFPSIYLFSPPSFVSLISPFVISLFFCLLLGQVRPEFMLSTVNSFNII